MKSTSIIKDNDEIYTALVQRKKELGLTNTDLSLEALRHGVKIPSPQLSKYFSRKHEYGLSESAILWLCDRYSIEVTLGVKKQEYDEFNALLNLKIKYAK